MDETYYADIVINKEKLSDGSDVYVVHCPSLGIATQGSTTEEAIYNIKEAVELYLEEEPNKYEELGLHKGLPMFSVIEVNRNAKATHIIR